MKTEQYCGTGQDLGWQRNRPSYVNDLLVVTGVLCLALGLVCDA